jgi:hypothetical protein
MTSDLSFKAIGRNDSYVTYEEAEPFTTKVKHMDFSKEVRDLQHNPRITPEVGICRLPAFLSLNNGPQMGHKWAAKSGMKIPPSFSSEGHVTIGFMGVSVISNEGDSR